MNRAFSKLMLGTVQFGMNYGINNSLGKPDDDAVAAILKTAADGGINVLDTARSYGDSEEVLGRVLKKTGLERHFCIVTKIKVFPTDLKNDQVAAWIENSLLTSMRNLGREHLDGLLLHDEANLDYYEELVKWAEKGVVNFSGTSMDSVSGIARLAELNITPGAVQVPGNILDRRFDELAHRLKQIGKPVFVRSVYLQGLLFKKDMHPVLAAAVLPVRKKLEALASDAGMSPAELYFRFQLSNEDYSSMLIGVDSAEQLKQNVALAAKGVLPVDILQRIREIVPAFPENIIRPGKWPR